ncbi:hypothetical protein E8E14_002633 [Neopestalotiopsis sp. 37M]|nr:hypothetical protein E8E14_002633 [Neopestalotiopsis sp. 37M]
MDTIMLQKSLLPNIPDRFTQLLTETPTPQQFQFTRDQGYQNTGHETPGDAYTAEPLPDHSSAKDWSSPFCSPSPITPVTETIKSNYDTNGGHATLRRHSFIHRQSVISDCGSAAASPGGIDSPYSNNNNNCYFGTIPSLQSHVSSPPAVTSGTTPLLLPPPPPPPYPRGGQGGILIVSSQQHERSRQKNRAAAARCREKTRHYADQLRGRERDLSSQKAVLTACVADLRDEVLALKNEILRHSGCDCDHIQKYLTAAANSIA